jgi:hypothetical protein
MSEPLSAAVQALPLNCSDPKILEFIVAATAPNTRRAYQSDVRHFIASGGRIPATYEQVARYLADHAAVLSIWLRSPAGWSPSDRPTSGADWQTRPSPNSFASLLEASAAHIVSRNVGWLL